MAQCNSTLSGSANSRRVFPLILLLLFIWSGGCGDYGLHMTGRIVDSNGKELTDASIVVESLDDSFSPLDAMSDNRGEFVIWASASRSANGRHVAMSVKKDGFADVHLQLRIADSNPNVMVTLYSCPHSEGEVPQTNQPAEN